MPMLNLLCGKEIKFIAERINEIDFFLKYILTQNQKYM